MQHQMHAYINAYCITKNSEKLYNVNLFSNETAIYINDFYYTEIKAFISQSNILKKIQPLLLYKKISFKEI